MMGRIPIQCKPGLVQVYRNGYIRCPVTYPSLSEKFEELVKNGLGGDFVKSNREFKELKTISDSEQWVIGSSAWKLSRISTK